MLHSVLVKLSHYHESEVQTESHFSNVLHKSGGESMHSQTVCVMFFLFVFSTTFFLISFNINT